MTIKMKDIIWLAGLLEGEGWFGLHHKKYPSISIAMTDEDVIIRVAALIKSNIYRQRNAWVAQVSGTYAIGWMMTLYTLLGKRRRSAVVNAIKVWRERSRNLPRGLHPACHPDKKVHALDLCRACYTKQWRKKQLLEVT